MNKYPFTSKGLAVGIILLFIAGCCTPGLSSTSLTKKDQSVSFAPRNDGSTEKPVVTCVAFGQTRNMKQQITLTEKEAALVFEQLRQLKTEITQHPFSEKTRVLKRAFVDLLAEKNLIPAGASKETYLSLLSPKWVERIPRFGNKPLLSQPFTNHGTCALCSLGGDGSGLLIPLFMLPRPRLVMFWLGNGESTTANLLTSKGYVAGGAQTGSAFGFTGIGLSYAVPGYSLYGFVGYALLASTTAEYMEHYPPNRAPVISDVTPTNGEQNVPLSLTELQFRIQDPDGDLMSYSVTTSPDIGSANGNLKPFGVYKIPINSLQSQTTYTWHISVTDGKETTSNDFIFTTASVEPVISKISPENGERFVPSDLTELRFTLTDFQDDAMDYTIETSPNIGSAHVIGVHDGTYTVPVSNVLQDTAYRWFVNVTDGTHPVHKTFSFITGFPAHFNPFDYGWQYRKQITINHTNIAGDVENFPVLVNITDTDLGQKARVNGEDILFMNNSDLSTRFNYEIENFNHDTGTLVAWVNVTHLSSSQDTTFYMYYGNPSSLPQQYPEKTWDSNYLMVQHMKDTTPSTISDSTINKKNGTKTGASEPIQIAGKIGNGQDFDGTNDIITFDDESFFDNSFDGYHELSFEFWLNSDTVTGGQPYITKGNDPTDTCVYSYDSKLFFTVKAGSVSDAMEVITPSTLSAGVWNHWVVTYTGSGLPSGAAIYQNGNSFGLTTNHNTLSSAMSSNIPVKFGDVGLSWRINGKMDEVRISNIKRSPIWISTEYNNQNNPSDFLSVGPEVPHP
jgi:hypothetical protein